MRILFLTDSPLTPARNRKKSLKRTGSDSPTTMLKTISEVPAIDINDSAINQDENCEDDPLHSEGSSSSLKSGESGIDMADGIFSLGKKRNSRTSPAGLQNGNQSPGSGSENVMTSTPRDPKTKSKLDFTGSPPPLSRENDSVTRSAEWMHCELRVILSMLSPGPFGTAALNASFRFCVHVDHTFLKG